MRPYPAKREKVNPRKLHESYMEKIERDMLERHGVFMPEPERGVLINSEFLGLPAMITDVTSADLGERLNAFTQQKMYLRTVLMRVELCLEEAKRAYFAASESGYRELSHERLTETAKDRILNSRPEVRPLYEAYADWKHKAKIAEYSIASVEDAVFMLSREVTRRTADMDEFGRNHSLTGG
jgi:hypothetical protein